VRVEGAVIPSGALVDEREFDFGVAAPASGRARLVLLGLGALALEFAPRMRHLQLWSLPDRPFVCVEPFWGPAGAVNGPHRDEIAPGCAHDYWMRVELT
jgi:galactose mutarotase-like enzyme